MKSTTPVLHYDDDSELMDTVVTWLRPRVGDVLFSACAKGQLREMAPSTPDRELLSVYVSPTETFAGSDAIGAALKTSSARDTRLLGRLVLEQPSREVARWVMRAFVRAERALAHRR